MCLKLFHLKDEDATQFTALTKNGYNEIKIREKEKNMKSDVTESILNRNVVCVPLTCVFVYVYIIYIWFGQNPVYIYIYIPTLYI